MRFRIDPASRSNAIPGGPESPHPYILLLKPPSRNAVRDCTVQSTSSPRRFDQCDWMLRATNEMRGRCDHLPSANRRCSCSAVSARPSRQSPDWHVSFRAECPAFLLFARSAGTPERAPRSTVSRAWEIRPGISLRRNSRHRVQSNRVLRRLISCLSSASPTL